MIRPNQSLAFHAAAPDGAEGCVLLVETRLEPGRVLVRRWQSPHYMAEAPPREQQTSELREDIARKAREGWRFTLPPESVLAWLDALVS